METQANSYVLNKFDSNLDEIAVVIREFTFKKKADIFIDSQSVPYIVSLAISEKDAKNGSLRYNSLPFPNVSKGDTLSFDGVGHLVYGPGHPGEFLAYSILFIESDKNIDKFSQILQTIVKSKATEIKAKALMAESPTYATAAMIIQEITQFLSAQLKQNNDYELYRRNGTLLKNMIPPYDVSTTFKGENDYICATTSIIPLSDSSTFISKTKAAIKSFFDFFTKD